MTAPKARKHTDQDPLGPARAVAELSENLLMTAAVVRGGGSGSLKALRMLRDDDLLAEEHRVLRRAILALAERKQTLCHDAILHEVISMLPLDRTHEVAKYFNTGLDCSHDPEGSAEIILDFRRREQLTDAARRIQCALLDNDRAALRAATEEISALISSDGARSITENLTDWRALASKPFDFLIPSWLQRRAVTVLGSAGGVGKSFLSVALAIQCITGNEMLSGLAVTGREPVLLVDLENDKETTLKRIAGYENHYRLDNAYMDECIEKRLHMVNRRGAWVEPVPGTKSWTTTDRYEDMVRLCRTHKPGLIIVDHLRRISGPVDGQDNALMGYMLELCDRLATEANAAVLLLAHTNKAARANEPGAANIRGASSIVDEARSVWEMRRDGELLTLVRVKANNASTLQDPIAFKMTKALDTVCLEVAEGYAAPVAPRPRELARPVAMWIADHPDQIVTHNAVKQNRSDGARSLFSHFAEKLPGIRPSDLHDAIRIALQNRLLIEQPQAKSNRHQALCLVAGPALHGVGDRRAAQEEDEGLFGPAYDEPDDDVPF